MKSKQTGNGKARLRRKPSSNRIGENPPYGMSGGDWGNMGIMPRAPQSYSTCFCSNRSDKKQEETGETPGKAADANLGAC